MTPRLLAVNLWFGPATGVVVMRLGIASSALLVVMLAGSLLLTGCGASNGDDAVVRVGYQKWGTYSILKASGQLERVFAARGWRVEWLEFPAGPPLLEALKAGSIDLGHAGDSPPLFAQAAGVPFVYIAVSSASPESSAILVRDDSNIRTVLDLKGKRVGFTKGTSGHTMVVRALEKHGLTVADITPVYLPPADGRVALESAAVDAWSIWGPYSAAAEQAGKVRRLVGGTGCVTGREFYFASRKAVDERRDVVQAFLGELLRVKTWARENRAEVNRLLAEQTKIDPAAVSLAEARRNRYDTGPLTVELVADQQALADRYVELGLLPHRIDVKAVIVDIPFGRTD